MNSRPLVTFALFVLSVGASSGTLALPRSGPTDLRSSAPSRAVTHFKISTDTQIPGKLLGAGDYSIRVVDHLADRMIVRIEGPAGEQTNFLALPKSELSTTAKGAILAKGAATGQSAMRGFAFADGTIAEFVFPKAEAVSLAKSNGSTFPAIDPESEGRAPAASLSKDDMDMVTLWLLTPTTVGPNDSGPGIKAAKYQASLSGAPLRRPKPLLAVLPHTASEGPLMMLVGGMLITAAAWMTGRRRSLRQS